MKKSIALLIAISTFSLGQEMQPEAEKEWKIIAKASDHHVEDAAIMFLKKADASEDKSAKEKATLKRLKELVSSPRLEITPKDLLKLKKVRSTQISSLGVFDYPYFNCRFKNTGSGVFFEKTSGSQRKSGIVFQDDNHSLIFLGASTVNQEAQREYSRFKRGKDTQHDSAGVIIKRGKTYLMIIPGKKDSFEVYEFK